MPIGPTETTTRLIVGSVTAIQQGLGFLAQSVYVENYSNQTVSLPDIGAFVPPYNARMLDLQGTATANIKFGAPPGAVQVASIAGQICNATWSERPAQSTGGPIGPAQVTTNYYDRNPTSIVQGYLNSNVAPHASTTRWTYTVPANRQAFVETAQAVVELEAVGDLAVTPLVGFASSFITVLPVGGGSVNFVVARVQDVAPARSFGGSLVGSSIALQAGDTLVGATANVYTATNATHLVSAKITEFD